MNSPISPPRTIARVPSNGITFEAGISGSFNRFRSASVYFDFTLAVTIPLAVSPLWSEAPWNCPL